MSDPGGMDGRQIKEYGILNDGQLNTCRPLPGYRFFFESHYCGDHSENWVICYDETGVEVSRDNARYLAYIIWEQQKGEGSNGPTV